MERTPFADRVSVVAALGHPLSRRAYLLVADRGWVSRDAAAAELGVARSVAAFHLDKLLDAGLIEARFERTSGRTGPGAGRTAKLYGCSSREVDLSLPPRRYDVAGELLAEALDRISTDPDTADHALARVAADAGERIGRAAAGTGRRRARRRELLEVLAEHGYRPRTDGRDVALANCPFRALSSRHPALVCQMNLDLLSGVLAGLGCADTVRARLQPADGACCVRFGPRRPHGGAAGGRGSA